jgi:hypothetical protein
LWSPTLERFSNSREVIKMAQRGFFLRKKPLEAGGFPLRQLEPPHIADAQKTRIAECGAPIFVQVGAVENRTTRRVAMV